MSTQHTATPWAITGQPQNMTDTCGYTVTDANGELVAEFETYTQAIAAVDAVNAHDDLVKALQGVLPLLNYDQNDPTDPVCIAIAALAKAGAA